MPDLRGDVRAGRTGAYDGRGLAPWVVLLLLILLAATAALLVPRARAEAPGFTLRSTGLENGQQGDPVAFSLLDYRGKVVVLDLMAVACESCRDVTENVLKPIWASSRGANGAQNGAGDAGGFAILSVDAWADPSMPMWQPGWETEGRLVALQKETKVPWRHALDTDHVWQKYGVAELPRVLVLDGDGRIVLDHAGAPDLGTIQAALAEAMAR